MKIIYSFLSLLLTGFILLGCLICDVIIGQDAILEFSKLINKNFFEINIIFLILIIDFFCIFGIILLLHMRKNSKYTRSSIFASGISIIFFTLFIYQFDIVKKFYFASNEFSTLVKSAFKNICITNFSIGLLLIIIIFIRRNKNEKKF